MPLGWLSSRSVRSSSWLPLRILNWNQCLPSLTHCILRDKLAREPIFIYIVAPGDLSFVRDLSTRQRGAGRWAETYVNDLNWNWIAQQVKFDQLLGNQKIHIWLPSYCCNSHILYALQVTAAWIHRLEVKPMKMVIATLVSRLCRDYLYFQRSTHHHHLASDNRIDMDETSVVEGKEPGQQMTVLHRSFVSRYSDCIWRTQRWNNMNNDCTSRRHILYMLGVYQLCRNTSCLCQSVICLRSK